MSSPSCALRGGGFARLTLGALAAVALLLAVMSMPAAARPLGHNGEIAFGRYDPFFDDTVPYTINPDGTHEQQVVHLPFEAPHFSPDGMRLAACCGVSGATHGAAAVLDPDSHTVRAILPQPDPENLDAYCTVWSPDGARLACEAFGTASDPSRTGIYTIRSSDGGGLRRLTSAPGGDDHPGDYSPDGRRLAIVRDGASCFRCVYVVNANGTGLHPVTSPSDGVVSSDPSWSPRGNMLVFSVLATPDVHSSLWVVHSDGSDLHEIHVQVAPGQYECGAPKADPTAGGCFAPSWSPDGKKIVFGRGGDTLGRNIFTVNADGSGLFQVTHGGVSQLNNDPYDWGTHPLATG